MCAHHQFAMLGKNTISATAQFLLACLCTTLQLTVIILLTWTNPYSTLHIVYVTSFTMSWLATNAASLFWLVKADIRDVTNRIAGYVMHICQVGTLWRYVNVIRSHDADLYTELANIRLIQCCTQYLPGIIMLVITLLWNRLPDSFVIIIIVTVFLMVLSSAVTLCIHFGHDGSETTLQNSLKVMPLKAVLIGIRVISTAMFISVYTSWIFTVILCHVVISLIVNCVTVKTDYSVPYKHLNKKNVYSRLTSDLAVNTLVSYMSFFDADFTIWRESCEQRGKLIIVLYVSNFVENALMVTLYTQGSSIRDATSLVTGMCIVINVVCVIYSSYRLFSANSSDETDNESIKEPAYSVQYHISPYHAGCTVQMPQKGRCGCEDYTVFSTSDAYPLLDMYKSPETKTTSYQEHDDYYTIPAKLKDPEYSPYTLTGLNYSDLYCDSTCSNVSDYTEVSPKGYTPYMDYTTSTSTTDSCSATYCEICDYQTTTSTSSSSDWSSNEPYFSPPGVSTYCAPRIPLAPQITSKEHVMNWLSQHGGDVMIDYD